MWHRAAASLAAAVAAMVPALSPAADASVPAADASVPAAAASVPAPSAAGGLHGSFSSLDYPGSAHTWPEGITNSGVVFGQFETTGGRFEGFVLRRGRWRAVNDPAADWNMVVGVLASGAVVGDDLVGSTMHGFEERRGHFSVIGDPRATAAPTALGYGGTSVGAAGSGGLLVGSFADGTATRGLFRENGRFRTFTYPGRLGRSLTELTGTDAGGDLVVGIAGDGSTWQAFVLKDGRLRRRNAPSQPHAAGAETALNGVSPDGDEIAGAWTEGEFGGVEHGFVILSGRFVGLEDPAGGFGTEPTGVNDHGVVVGYILTSSGAHGFLFRPA